MFTTPFVSCHEERGARPGKPYWIQKQNSQVCGQSGVVMCQEEALQSVPAVKQICSYLPTPYDPEQPMELEASAIHNREARTGALGARSRLEIQVLHPQPPAVCVHHLC